jgi:hypothetical protein
MTMAAAAMQKRLKARGRGGGGLFMVGDDSGTRPIRNTPLVLRLAEAESAKQ